METTTTLIPRTPRKEDKRTVYCHVHVGRLGTQKVPKSLDSPEWVPWINATPKDIEAGIISGLAANKAFREAGGAGLFHFTPTVDVVVHLFDPAEDLISHGQIKTANQSVFTFRQ